MAITLWQPWAWAISDYTKRIENRTWAPPNWRKGQTMAIHAGATIDPNGTDSKDVEARIIKQAIAQHCADGGRMPG